MNLETEFEAIYKEHASKVRALLFYKCGAQNVDDLVQQTFLKIWRGLKKFQGQSTLKTWVYKVALNVANDFYRKRGSIGEHVSSENLYSNANPDTKIIIEQVFAKMSGAQKDLCILFYYNEFTIQEISSILQLPEGTVKSRLFELRKTLQFLIKGDQS